MQEIIEIACLPQQAFDESYLRAQAFQKVGIKNSEAFYCRVIRRSIDARSRIVLYRLALEVGELKGLKPLSSYEIQPNNVSAAKEVIVIGAGPAGLFAALRLIELGYKPIILERGTDVRTRRRDLAAINKDNVVNPESNYCFGEGGAGTYSDGKLYTRSKKRGDLRKVLEMFVAHGAKEDILVDTHPHIGTNKLPAIIQTMRESIIAAGGEVLFNAKVTRFILASNEFKGVETSAGISYTGVSCILATGHSARDIFELLNEQKIYIEAKPFALGLRVEHPQEIIDQVQYHCNDRGPYLPASSYSLVQQVAYNKIERGVYSFCMCPGGFIVPAATAQDEIVVNGMSPSRRDSKYANSGIVVSVELEDIPEFGIQKALACMAFQKSVEHKAWLAAGKTQAAPAQRLVDFVNGKLSVSLPDTSYQPGLTSVVLDEVLPPFISQRLKGGFKAFGQKMKGFYTNEAQVVGVESRTSSPVMVPRNKETLEHVQVKRFYPCGEGAGYAGGIVSAAIDGMKCAEAIAAQY
ncbi:MAG: FAD-dependent dehydrogenase [Chitinophagaceae bacterium]|nr:FAD-dependent dehydrogenase [Chitinophagaceae bacterium]